MVACSSNPETKTCVGQVACFVKAEPRTPAAKSAAARLGLPTHPQRFAIVDAYVAEDVQTVTKDITLQTEGVKEVAGALVAARLLSRPRQFLSLLERVRQQATVLAVGKASQVRLRGPNSDDAAAGALTRLAIPLSSNLQASYPRCHTGAVAPVCMIDPRTEKIVMDVEHGPMQAAVRRITDTKLYFVHTFSKSNSKRDK